MSSRDLILNNISKFQNDATLTISTNFETTEDSISEFIKNATLAGANVIKTSNEDIKSQLSQSIIQKDDYFIYESEIGVGENGALWCTNLANDRKKLFLCNDLVIKIKATNIVANMHQAYEKISFENKEFGTFIAGPSKTADIEQSLVLGAHGAMGLDIYLVE